MKKSVKKNYIYNMLYQLLIIILPIITTPYLARILGSEGNGIYSYTISIVTYFILLGSLGVSMYGEREIAYVQNDKIKRSKVFFELFIFRFITMTLSAIIFYICFARSGEYATYYKILLLEMLANCFDISWFFQGMEDFKKTVIRNFIIKIISVVSIFTFVKNANDVGVYLLIYTLSTLFGSLTLWIGIHKYIEIPKKINIFSHLKSIFILFIPQVAIQIYVVLDKTMIGAILNDMSEVGYYEQAQKIIKILLTIITAVGTVMMPRIANCYANGDMNRIKEYMKKTFRFIFFCSIPLTLGIIAVSNNFVPLFFGTGYDKVPMLMKILSLIIIFISMSNVTGTQFLLATKRQKEFTISVVVGAIVNFCLNMILIRLFKSYGAAIATVLAELSVTGVQLYFIRDEFKLSDILNGTLKFWIAGLVMFISCYLIDIIIVNNLTGLLLQVFCGVCFYFGILLILKDKFMLEIIDNGLRIIKLRK